MREPQKIQSDIQRASGTLLSPLPCSCGATPYHVNLAYGIHQVKCTCGRIAPPAKSEGLAVGN